jgi:hypothetical protein
MIEDLGERPATRQAIPSRCGYRLAAMLTIAEFQAALTDGKYIP